MRVRDRVRISILGTCTAIKPAKFAVRDADIRMVKMPVDVVIGCPAVLLAPDMVGEFPDGIEVVGRIKRHPLVKRQPLAILDLVGDVL